MSTGLCRPAAKESLKNARQILSGDSTPAVSHLQLNQLFYYTLCDTNLTCKRKLERIGDEVHHDLFPLVAVDVHRLGKRFAMNRQGEAGMLERRAEHTGQV